MALVERKLELLEWKQPNTNVGGFLTRADVVTFKDGGKAMRYMIEREGGSLVAFRGATQLDMLITPRDLGKFIQLTYLGEDETREMTQGRSRPKLFKLSVDNERKIDVQKHLDGDPGISDADIPF